VEAPAPVPAVVRPGAGIVLKAGALAWLAALGVASTGAWGWIALEYGIDAGPVLPMLADQLFVWLTIAAVLALPMAIPIAVGIAVYRLTRRVFVIASAALGGIVALVVTGMDELWPLVVATGAAAGFSAAFVARRALGARRPAGGGPAGDGRGGGGAGPFG
jgi:hypothetical protein